MSFKRWPWGLGERLRVDGRGSQKLLKGFLTIGTCSPDITLRSRAWRHQAMASAISLLICAACSGFPGRGSDDIGRPMASPRPSSEPAEPADASPTTQPTPEGYPKLAASADPSQATIEAQPTARNIDAEILSVLPAGAKPASTGSHVWNLAVPGPDRIYGLAYRLDKQLSVAAVLLPISAPPQLLWDLARDGGLAEAIDEAWPIDLLNQGGQAIVVKTAGGGRLLRLSFDGTAPIVEPFELPGAFEATPKNTYYANLIERDLSGDGRPDHILALDGVRYYERLADGENRLAGRLDPADLLIDQDRDGLPDLVKPGADGTWTLHRWRDGSYQATGESLADPPSRPPVTLTDGALPALPGNISFLVQGERALKRWPKEGGALRTLWSAGGRELSMRGLQVSEDGSALLLALAPDASGYAGPARLSLVDSDGRETELPTYGELRGFTVSPDGRRIAYVGLGVGPDGRALPKDSPFPVLEQGTVFEIDRDAPDRATGLADCAAVQANPWWVVGCLGSVVSSPDSRSLAFADARGLWLVSFDGAEPRMVIQQYYVENDGPGSRIYYPERFAPDGQGLLVSEGGYEGLSPAILDLATGEAREIPDAWDYGRSSEQVWRPDGSGLLLSRWGSDEELQSELRLVDVASPEVGRPVLDLVPISAGHRYLAYGPAVATDGGLRFGLRHADARLWLANGVYRSAADGSALQRLTRLPALSDPYPKSGQEELIWSPDGDAFVLRYREEVEPRAQVGLADGSALWDASALLGRADRIRWSR